MRVFGSVARGEATAESDLDLLVKMTKPLGFAFAGLHLELEEQLGMPIQIVPDTAIHPMMKEGILHDARPL